MWGFGSSSIECIKIAENKNKATKPKEIPLDDDGKLLLSKVKRYFSKDVIGIEYYNVNSKTYRVIDLNENEDKLCPPKSGWSSEITYVCMYKQGKKSANSSYSNDNTKNIKDKFYDLIMWRLSKEMKENDLKSYLEKFGEVKKISIEMGFGHIVIRFPTLNNKTDLLSKKNHVISDRVVNNVRLLKNTNEIKNFQPNQLHVRMQPNNLTVKELHEYFTKIVTKYEFVYVYKPVADSNFAFVTYMNGEIAQKLCTEKLPEYKDTNIVVELAKQNNKNEFRKKREINRKVEQILQKPHLSSENQVNETTQENQTVPKLTYDITGKFVTTNQSQEKDNSNNGKQRNNVQSQEISKVNNEGQSEEAYEFLMNYERNSNNQQNYRDYCGDPHLNRRYQENMPNYGPQFEYYNTQFDNYVGNRPRFENDGNEKKGNESSCNIS